jgi:uncharacterized protein (TIRG00374 family)
LTAGVTVSVVCLYFATRSVDWADVGRILAGARPGWLGAVVVASIATVYIRAQRWRVLLRPLGEVPLYPALSATAIGFGASAVLPFRLGELLRPALLGRRAGVGMSAALSSVVLERLFDLLLVIGCFLAIALAYPIPLALQRSAFGLAAFAGAGLALLVAMQRNQALARALVGLVLDRLPADVRRRLGRLGEAFLGGLGALSDLPTVALVLWYSAYLWGVITLTFLFSFLALGTQVPLVAASLTTVVIVAAAVFLPQAPGFIGPWQAGCVLALTLFGVSREAAVSYSWLTWIVQMLVNVGTASVFLVREDISLGQLMRVAEGDTPVAGPQG